MTASRGRRGSLGQHLPSFLQSSQRREAIRGSARWISATIYANFNLSISVRERKRVGGEERDIKRHVRWAGEVPRYQRWSLRNGARGREGDYGHSVWRAHQSVRGRQEEEWIHFRRHHARAKLATAASQTLACPGKTLHAAAAPWTTGSLFCSLCVLPLDCREQQWRRRSSYDFTVVRSLVFSSPFSRGKGRVARHGHPLPPLPPAD